jgi:hypothetical protein
MGHGSLPFSDLVVKMVKLCKIDRTPWYIIWKFKNPPFSSDFPNKTNPLIPLSLPSVVRPRERQCLRANLVTYSALCTACEKVGQWQQPGQMNCSSWGQGWAHSCGKPAINHHNPAIWGLFLQVGFGDGLLLGKPSWWSQIPNMIYVCACPSPLKRIG